MKIKNPITGTEHEMQFDADGNPVSYVEKQTIPNEQFAYAREMNERKSTRPNTQKHWQHIGKIPYTIWVELKKQGITENKVKLMKWLEDNRAFLVHSKDRF